MSLRDFFQINVALKTQAKELFFIDWKAEIPDQFTHLFFKTFGANYDHPSTILLESEIPSSADGNPPPRSSYPEESPISRPMVLFCVEAK
jgi:hypothetical protein